MNSRSIVKDALNRLSGGEAVEEVANSLIYGAETTKRRPVSTKVETDEAEDNEVATETDLDEDASVIIDCFECDEFSADNEEDLLAHYEESHSTSYESVEKLFEAYDLNFEEAIASLSEEDDCEDDEDDDEGDEEDDEKEESVEDKKDPLA